MSEGGHEVREWAVAAESWVAFVRQGKDYFRDKLNNSGMFHLIGNVNGLLVLDVARGEGYNDRTLKLMGNNQTTASAEGNPRLT